MEAAMTVRRLPAPFGVVIAWEAASTVDHAWFSGILNTRATAFRFVLYALLWQATELCL
jgi:hypothetical protein